MTEAGHIGTIFYTTPTPDTWSLSEATTNYNPKQQYPFGASKIGKLDSNFAFTSSQQNGEQTFKSALNPITIGVFYVWAMVPHQIRHCHQIT